jgi:hypothetical protein
MSWYNVSSIVMRQTPPKSLVMVKKEAAPRTCTIRYGMWPYMRW